LMLKQHPDMKKSTTVLCLLMLLFACQSGPQDNYQELDLLEYGIPVTIMAPDSAEVKSSDMGGVLKDVTVKGKGGYDLQVMASSTNSSDVAKAKAEELASVKSNRYFSKIVEEKEDGFLYEVVIDSAQHYGFRHIVLQGDQQVVFSQGMTSTLSEEEARKIYESVKKD